MKENKNKINKLGFTLIELIIVIAVIALLAASVFVAVDPAKRIGQARDAQRWSDVVAISDAIQQYIADNGGTFPTSTADLVARLGYNNYAYLLGVGTNDDGVSFDSDFCPNQQTVEPSTGVSLSNLVPTYLPTLPVDPGGPTNNGVTIGYYFLLSSSGRVTIGACEESAYSTASIVIQR